MSDTIRVLREARDFIWLGCANGKHDWRFAGGRNACCRPDDCGCSVPVHECDKCGDCDYGDNPEADDMRRKCAETRADDHPTDAEIERSQRRMEQLFGKEWLMEDVVCLSCGKPWTDWADKENDRCGCEEAIASAESGP